MRALEEQMRACVGNPPACPNCQRVVALRCAEIASEVSDSYDTKDGSVSTHAVGAETVGVTIRREFGLEDRKSEFAGATECAHDSLNIRQFRVRIEVVEEGGNATRPIAISTYRVVGVGMTAADVWKLSTPTLPAGAAIVPID
jgi:hypothetical protein